MTRNPACRGEVLSLQKDEDGSLLPAAAKFEEQRRVIANRQSCEAIPVYIKAMFFNAEVAKDAEERYILGETQFLQRRCFLNPEVVTPLA